MRSYRMLRRLTGLWILRRVSRDLSRIAQRLDDQNALLTRLTNHLAPLPLEPDRPTLRQDTGVDHFDPVDAILAQDYIERTTRQTGHVPDDDEVLIYLADEKTTDLHRRLIARDQELARLAAARR